MAALILPSSRKRTMTRKVSHQTMMPAADIFLNSTVRRKIFNASAHNLYYSERTK